MADDAEPGFVVTLDPEQRATVVELWGEKFVAIIEAQLTEAANAYFAQRKEQE